MSKLHTFNHHKLKNLIKYSLILNKERRGMSAADPSKFKYA